MVGLDRLELSTPRLSSVCSNQLSYRPFRGSSPVGKSRDGSLETEQRRSRESFVDLKPGARSRSLERPKLLRKEVIQPQVLLQLPCYDFTPITDHTLGGCAPCGFAHRFLVQPTFVM